MPVCAASGLELVEGPIPGSYRIARSSFGPLNPVLRELQSDGTVDSDGWGRFDTRAAQFIPATISSRWRTSWVINGPLPLSLHLGFATP